MTGTEAIRRLPNGSIDTGYYTHIGRQRRSEALYDGGHAIAKMSPIVTQAVKRSWSRLTVQCLGNISANVRSNSSAS